MISFRQWQIQLSGRRRPWPKNSTYQWKSLMATASAKPISRLPLSLRDHCLELYLKTSINIGKLYLCPPQPQLNIGQSKKYESDNCQLPPFISFSIFNPFQRTKKLFLKHDRWVFFVASILPHHPETWYGHKHGIHNKYWQFRDIADDHLSLESCFWVISLNALSHLIIWFFCPVSGRNDHNHDRYQGEMMLETRVQPQFAGWPLIGRLFCPPPILFNPAPLFPWFVLRNCCKKGTYLIRFGRRTHHAHAHQFVVASHAAFLATTQITSLIAAIIHKNVKLKC